MAKHSLLTTIRRELKSAAEPSRAAGMQAYMKSTMPYHGVTTVPLRAVCKQVFRDVAYKHDAAWQQDVLAIWRDAKFREERYAAIELSGHRRASDFQTMRALPMY